MISLIFLKIETKNLNLDPQTNHQLHISCLNIRSDHDTQAATREYSLVPLKTVKLVQDINIFI